MSAGVTCRPCFYGMAGYSAQTRIASITTHLLLCWGICPHHRLTLNPSLFSWQPTLSCQAFGCKLRSK
jgi:predicted membrane protein